MGVHCDYLIAACLLLVSCASAQRHYNQWDNHVWSGRQFDDSVTKTQVASPEVIRPALLVLYTPRCESALTREHILQASFPRAQYLVFAKHDYRSSRENVWYEFDARDDLEARYQPTNCPEYLFFAEGTTLDNPERYDRKSRDQVRHWIWDKFSVEFSFQNTRNRDVVVEFHGRGPEISAFSVQTGQDFIFHAYISYCMLVSDAQTKKFIYGRLLDHTVSGQMIVVTDGMLMEVKPNEWYGNIQQQLDEEEEKWRKWRWNVAEIYLMDFKQPLLMPRFTSVGYKHLRMPEHLYKELKEFYERNLHNRQEEQNKCEPAINDSEIKCGFVPFDANITQFVADVMKPIMEEWSKTDLVLSRLYGIREYYTGNLLRNHVDRVTTHIVSVILQISKDLGGEPDWELEVIDYNGKRQNVTLESGDMLFYESASLIHGRPFPFKGKVFANAFLHYRPAQAWEWDLTPDGKDIIKANIVQEHINDFPSTLTYRPGKKGLMQRDEL